MQLSILIAVFANRFESVLTCECHVEVDIRMSTTFSFCLWLSRQLRVDKREQGTRHDNLTRWLCAWKESGQGLRFVSCCGFVEDTKD